MVGKGRTLRAVSDGLGSRSAFKATCKESGQRDKSSGTQTRRLLLPADPPSATLPPLPHPNFAVRSSGKRVSPLSRNLSIQSLDRRWFIGFNWLTLLDLTFRRMGRQRFAELKILRIGHPVLSPAPSVDVTNALTL